MAGMRRVAKESREAGGQTAQNRRYPNRIFFLFADIGKFFAQLLKGFFKFGVNAFVNQRVDKRTAEQNSIDR